MTTCGVTTRTGSTCPAQIVREVPIPMTDRLERVCVVGHSSYWPPVEVEAPVHRNPRSLAHHKDGRVA